MPHLHLCADNFLFAFFVELSKLFNIVAVCVRVYPSE